MCTICVFHQSSTCEASTQHSLSEYHEQLERLAEIDHQQHVAVQQMEQLRNDLLILLKGKGREGDAVLKTLDKITEEERVRVIYVLIGGTWRDYKIMVSFSGSEVTGFES